MGKKGGFEPMKLVPAPEYRHGSNSSQTVTCTLKGVAADEFEKMREEAGLSRSQLLRQMVYHCLGRSEELRDLYVRLAILGK